MKAANGYGILLDDDTLIPFCAASPRGIIGLIVRLTGMSREEAEEFFAELTIVKVQVSTID